MRTMAEKEASPAQPNAVCCCSQPVQTSEGCRNRGDIRGFFREEHYDHTAPQSVCRSGRNKSMSLNEVKMTMTMSRNMTEIKTTEEKYEGPLGCVKDTELT